MKKHPMLGEYCLIRTISAGVHIGEVIWINPKNSKEAIIKDARYLWEWYGAFTLNAVAVNGIDEGSYISIAVDKKYLTEVVEYIPITAKAKKTFKKSYAENKNKNDLEKKQ